MLVIFKLELFEFAEQVCKFKIDDDWNPYEWKSMNLNCCLIKGANAEDLGYLGDANVTEYETTLKKVQKKCPNPKYIIISHSDWNNINSLKHSIKLAKKLKKKNYR